MPKTQTVTLRYRASEAFWEIQCRAICELSICERRAYSLPSLLGHVAEKKIGVVGKLTPKDLLYFASTDSVCGDIPINIGVDKWANDRLRRVRRSEEHTPELQSRIRILYAVNCLKQINERLTHTTSTHKTKK